MVRGTWIRWLAGAIGVLAALWLAAWLALPRLVEWQGPSRLSKALGRPVTLGAVDFHPWSLELVLHDLAVDGAPGTAGPPLLHVVRVRADVALSSLWRRAPVLQALDVDQARIALARTAPGHYDIDDLLARFAPRADAPPSEPAHFALHNLQVHDLAVRFDDRPEGRVHVLDRVELSLPFVSNLPASVDVTVQPHLAFRLNGAAFDSAAQATPFAASRHGTLKLAVSDLDVRPYLGYLPESLPVRVAGGTLSAELTLAFARPTQGAPTLALTGWLAARDVAVDGAGGRPLLAWKQARVALADVEPLARKLAFDGVSLQGVQWHVDRAADGTIDALGGGARRPAAATTASTSASTSTRSPTPASAQAGAASAPASAPASPWEVRVAAVDVTDGTILWNDASTRPAVALVADGLALHATKLQWPASAPASFTLAAGVHPPAAAASAAARLLLEGSAGPQDAQVALALSGLPLQALAPYLAQHVVPRVDGRLGAKATLAWSDKPAAPVLRLAIAEATLDALRVQPPGHAADARWDRLSVNDLRLDLRARTATLGDATLTRPVVPLARDADGRFEAVRWLRAGPVAPAAPASSSDRAPPWHVQVRHAAIEDGLLAFSDASLHPEQPLPPLRAELRQLSLDVRDFAWFGDRSMPPARVAISARVGRPSAAPVKRPHGGRLNWTGTLGASPLAARGDLRVERFPVTLVTPWVADKLPVSLLRAQANYAGHVDLQSSPAGLTLATQGDARLADVHLTTLAAAHPPESAASASGELLGWQALSLKGVKFVLKPSAMPRLDIGQAEIDDLFARVVVTEQGRLNLQDIGAGAPPAAAAASAPAPAPAPAVAAASAPAAPAPLPLAIAIGGVTLVNGRIDYSDHFVQPHYSAALTDLEGSLGAFSSDSRDMAPLRLHGRAEGTALLDVSGRVNPLARPLALDIRAKATDLELAPLSPYAGKYAGYAIERGKLSMDVAYTIDADGRLEASNQVILNQLTFGEAIASPSATKLPVKLAIALLKDRNGVIDINLPISGSLNDPQFSVAGVVGRLLVNLLVKAVTSPFSLIAGAAGGGGGAGPSMDAIAFRPGTAFFTDASAPALDKVAAALKDRPALRLTITGSADAAVEGADLQREAIEAQLRTMARDDALQAGVPASAPAGAPVTLAPARHAELLATLYKHTRLRGKPRNLLGLAKDLPDDEMEALLARNVPVTDEATRQQALARAIAVRDALIARGVAGDRLFLAAPRVHAEAKEWTPRATLALSLH